MIRGRSCSANRPFIVVVDVMTSEPDDQRVLQDYDNLHLEGNEEASNVFCQSERGRLND